MTHFGDATRAIGGRPSVAGEELDLGREPFATPQSRESFLGALRRGLKMALLFREAALTAACSRNGGDNSWTQQAP